MVDADKQYAILTSNIAVPLDKLEALLADVIPVDYTYEKEVLYFARRSGLSDLKLISGSALIANEVADRMKDKK